MGGLAKPVMSKWFPSKEQEKQKQIYNNYLN